MSRPNASKMLRELAEHFATPQDGRGTADWIKAVKKAAGAEFKSIEVIYDEWKAKPKEDYSKADKPAQRVASAIRTESASTSTARTPISEVISPSSSSPDASINEGAVAIHVSAPEALPAQIVYIPPRDVLGVSSMLASRIQTMALGFAFGILVSKPVLKLLGLGV